MIQSIRNNSLWILFIILLLLSPLLASSLVAFPVWTLMVKWTKSDSFASTAQPCSTFMADQARILWHLLANLLVLLPCLGLAFFATVVGKITHSANPHIINWSHFQALFTNPLIRCCLLYRKCVINDHSASICERFENKRTLWVAWIELVKTTLITLHSLVWKLQFQIGGTETTERKISLMWLKSYFNIFLTHLNSIMATLWADIPLTSCRASIRTGRSSAYRSSFMRFADNWWRHLPYGSPLVFCRITRASWRSSTASSYL